MEFMESLSVLHLQLHLETGLSIHYNPLLYHNPVSDNNRLNLHQAHTHYEYDSSSGQNLSMSGYLVTAPIQGYSEGDEEIENTFGKNWDQFITQGPEITAIRQAVATDELPLRLPIWGIVIFVIGYALVFLFGVIGNCSVLFVVVRLKRMKTVTNYFIFSLALADLLVLLFCLLPNLVSNIFVPWVLGSFLCKTVPYIQGISVCASIYFLVAISVERCISIQWPFRYQVTKESVKIVIIAIWLWSCIVALPWAIFFQSGAFDPDNPHLQFCIEVWPESYEKWSTYYFLIGNFLICYVFPLGVILVCYLTIWFRVYRRPVPSDSYHKAMELIHQRSKIAVIKMLIVVVFIFALSWFPLYAIIIRVKVGPEAMSESESVIISIMYPVAQWLGCFNSCINPIVYSFLNHKFRKAFISILWGDRRKSRIRIKHKSPTVNILLKRFSTYRVETTVSKSNEEDSCDSM